MPGKLVIIQPDGKRKIRLYRTKEPPLETMQKLVEGWVTTMTVRFEHRILNGYVNEEGLPLKLDPNPTAADLTVHKRQVVGVMVIDVPEVRSRKRRMN